MDSDGDGITNGMELGDPDCVWAVGAEPPEFEGEITHPGVPNPSGNATEEMEARLGTSRFPASLTKYLARLG